MFRWELFLEHQNSDVKVERKSTNCIKLGDHNRIPKGEWQLSSRLTPRLIFYLPCGQVAGRLHVEVVRVAGGLEDNMAGGDELDNNQDSEVEDRKLVCMVSRDLRSFLDALCITF